MENIMLLCLSTLNPNASVNTYSYRFRDKTYTVQGRMTNEAPVKAVINKLYLDHHKHLDRIIMICSDKVNNEKIASLSADARIYELTHACYFEEIIGEYAKKIDGCYLNHPIHFDKVRISDFSKESEVIQAVVDSVKILSEQTDINLYIDFNGGPRNVAVLIMGLSNLLKLRNIAIKEITFMDYENKQDGLVSIENMDALFGCIDLVSGVSEYVNYGRILILKKYFEPCGNQTIQMILRVLEDFSNNMQLCLTDYVLANKEQVKSALNNYHADSNSGSSYEIMFSFVAQDILRGCRKLLDGSLPDMILWCIEKEFLQQALTFYIELLPSYLWENKLFYPTITEELQYAEWRLRCEYDPESIPNTYHDFSQHMDDKYYWMHYYLVKDMPDQETSSQETADSDTDIMDRYDICRITGCRIRETEQKVDYMLSLLEPEEKRVGSSIDISVLRQILAEYYLIHNQRISSRHSTVQLANQGLLWGYQEMRDVLHMAAARLHNLLPKCK